MFRNTMRKTVARGTLLALLLGLVACGGGGSGGGKNRSMSEILADSLDGITVGFDFDRFDFDPVGFADGPARILVGTDGAAVVIRIEREADRTPAVLDLTLGLDPALANALVSVAVADAGCPEPDVTITLEGTDLTVRIAHPAGAGVETEAAVQEIRLGFEGVEATADSIAVLLAAAIDDEGRRILLTEAPLEG